MIGNCFVIDSVVHAYNLTPENQLVQPVSGALSEMIYAMHLGCQPRGVTRYVLDRKRYYYALDTGPVSRKLLRDTGPSSSG